MTYKEQMNSGHKPPDKISETLPNTTRDAIAEFRASVEAALSDKVT
jgi:hypothetical protein